MNHSPIGPSSAKRILACPGSVKLCQNIKEQGQSSYAEEGTKAHEVVERYLNGLPLPSWATEEMIAGAKLYSSVIDDAFLSCSHVQTSLKVEEKVYASSINNDAYGTCDAYFIGDNTIFVFDYKFGKGVKVDADNNSQMLYYALAIRDMHPKLPIEKIELTIVQPRFDSVSTYNGSGHELDMFRKNFITALTKDTLQVSDACQFCLAIPICPKQKEEIYDKFNVVVDKPIQNCDTIENITPKQFQIYLDNAEMLKSWIGAVEKQAKTEMMRGMLIPGYDVQDSLSNRKWTDEAFVKRSLGSMYPPDLIYEKPKLKSPSQMEKVIPPGEVEVLVTREVTGKKIIKTDKEIINTFDHFEAFE